MLPGQPVDPDRTQALQENERAASSSDIYAIANPQLLEFET